VTLAFLAVLVVHVIHSLVTNRHDPAEPVRRMSKVQLAVQMPLFWMSCYLAIGQGVFSRQLLSPHYIILGMVCGHLIFVLSLLITHQSFSDAGEHLLDFISVWKLVGEVPSLLTWFLFVAFVEEMEWRVGAQYILIHLTGSAPLGIIVAALGFAIVHKHFFKNSFTVSLEFTAFAILLGFLYYSTGSFVLVAVIHALRDIEIAYLEYLIKVDELGDKDQALREFEKTFMRVTAVKTGGTPGNQHAGVGGDAV
jgi:membrane protease YdiL (CAAX protease family)